MHTSVTLTAEEFKLIHNGLCGLRSTTEILSNVLNTKVLDRLLAAQKNIEVGFKNAYKQEDQDYTEKSDHYEAIKADRGFKSDWSVFSVADLLQPHKYTGTKNLIYRSHWGAGEIVVPVEGQSWVDLWTAADKAINASGDDHHIFVEGFKVEGDNLELRTGS